MRCAECGQLLPEGARFCTGCGRRLVVEQSQPAITRRSDTPDVRARSEPALIRKPPSLDGSIEPRRARHRAATPPPPKAPPLFVLPERVMRHLPALMVSAGVALGSAIYWSAQSDTMDAAQAAADRIAAATGPLATSQPVPQQGSDFSARQALQGLFGNYDPHLDGAYWTVKDAPAAWSDWNGRRLLVKPLISRTDDAGARHVLVTSSADVRDGMVVKQGTACRTCKSVVGVALYQRVGDEWRLVSHRPFASVGGAWGAPPQVAVNFPARGMVELKIEHAAADPAGAVERRSLVMNDAGRVIKTRTPARQRVQRAASDDSPFPSSGDGP